MASPLLTSAERLPSAKRRGLRRFAPQGFATAIGAFMCCYAAKDGLSTSKGHTVSTMIWACNCATKHRSVPSKRNCETIAGQQQSRTKMGDGPCPRPAGDRQGDQSADDHRHLLALFAGYRSAFQLAEEVVSIGASL
jgi:hypothetical protein